MKLKYIVLCLSWVLACPWLMAQTMSDAQVKSYAKQRSSSGIDAKTIATELLTIGATREQLTRIYSEYNTGDATESEGTENEDPDRSRKDNGEKLEETSVKATKEEMVESMKIFGHDIFRSKKLTFEPNLTVAVPSNYELAPGDELIIDVYGESHATNKLKVAPDGTANVPRIGPVDVQGLTVDQAQARIRGKMSGHYEGSEIKLSVGQTRTIRIHVMGEVVTPGTFTLSAFATVFHALYMAGGVSETGTLREVKVVRDGRTVSTVDIYEYIVNGRLAGDVKLRDNDVIIVGSYINLVNVDGNVKRQMWYELKRGETLSSLLRYCSGFTSDAYTESVTVNRKAGEMLSVYTVKAKDYASFAMLDGDAVMVSYNDHRYSNAVSIEGAVKRPGQYQLDVVKSLRQLVKMAGGLQENAQKNRAVLLRLNTDRTQRTISINLENVMNGNAPDLVLENEDQVMIASMAAHNDERKLYIEGDVRKPGSYDYTDSTTVEDLITLAGGLLESASLINVEVARRIRDPFAPRDIELKSETFLINLPDNLEMSKESGFVLQPHDRVYIRRSPVYQKQNKVTLTGEVVFAGNYTLEDNTVRLSEIIQKAGGLKLRASAHDARLIRHINLTERAREKQLQELVKTAGDSINVSELEGIEDSYAVAIDLEEALAHPGGKSDILLRNGDEIIVPTKLSTVKISGEVLYPNNVTYIEGKDYHYYINEAGGFTKRSLRNRSYIVYANGHVSRLSKGKIEPGCDIVVPMKEEKTSNMDPTKWATIGTSIASVIALLITALK